MEEEEEEEEAEEEQEGEEEEEADEFVEDDSDIEDCTLHPLYIWLRFLTSLSNGKHFCLSQ